MSEQMTMDEAVEATRQLYPKRYATARAMFEMWARRTVVSTCRDWDGMSAEGQAIWIDMAALYTENASEEK